MFKIVKNDLKNETLLHFFVALFVSINEFKFKAERKLNNNFCKKIFALLIFRGYLLNFNFKMIAKESIVLSRNYVNCSVLFN